MEPIIDYIKWQINLKAQAIQLCKTNSEIQRLDKMLNEVVKTDCPTENSKLINQINILSNIDKSCQMDSYYPVYQLLKNHKEFVIFDLGCGTPIQQLLFRDFAGYIGIDDNKEASMVKILKNATLIRGDIVEIVPEIMRNKRKFHIENKELVAVSLYCCSVFGNCIDPVKKYFDRIITI